MNITDDDRRSPEEVAKLKEMGIECHDGIPIFPFVPDSIRQLHIYDFEAGSLTSEADLQELINRMWLEPEASFYYYHGFAGGPVVDNVLLAARNRGAILMDESERHYYRHPRYKHSYVHITPDAEGAYAWDWQSQTVEKGPELWRVVLQLSQRQRDELDAWRKIQLEEHYRQEARKAMYTYDVFLSYDAADEKEACGIHDQIMDDGHKVFMAPKVLKPGDDFAEEIRSPCTVRGSSGCS